MSDCAIRSVSLDRYEFQTSASEGDQVKAEAGGKFEPSKALPDPKDELTTERRNVDNVITGIKGLCLCIASYCLGASSSTPKSFFATLTRRSEEINHVDTFSKRQSSSAPACGGGGVRNKSEYDTPLHVGALLVVLFVSSTACIFPLLAIKFPKLRIPASFLFVSRHFGTGVLIATAFVHLLPTAFLSLGDPCLGDFWTSDYPAMPGAIALAAIFILALIEMVFSPGRHACTIPESITRRSPEGQAESGHASTAQTASEQRKQRDGADANDSKRLTRERTHITGRWASIGRSLSHLGEQSTSVQPAETRKSNLSKVVEEEEGVKHEAAISVTPPSDTITAPSPTTSLQLTPAQEHSKAVLQCTLLEMGILFHSIFIGMALSVATGNDFVVLLIAIVFHQTFEGLALGARIANIAWAPRAKRPWLMALAYGCTTPLGQALGLATHTLYDPDSQVGLIVVGVFNAMSSGLLTFASLVELLGEDFLSDHSWRTLRGGKRVWACVLVFLGAFGMALIGAWA